MYSPVFVFIGVVVQFLVAESKQGRYDNISVEACCLIDSNTTVENKVIHFNDTIYNADNLMGNLPSTRVLKTVKIQRQVLPVLYENSFGGLHTLHLYLVGCNVTEIKSYAFNKSVVSSLHCTQNPLRKIEKHAFLNMSVNVLHLNSNAIEHIEPGAFDGLQIVSRIECSLWLYYLLKLDEHLRRAEPDHTICYDTAIDLKLNNLETIQAGVFNNVDVRKIDLSFNKIRVLESDAFTHTNALRQLFLNNNAIVNITKNVFQSETLKMLALDGNKIEFIEPQSFSSLPGIETINLGNNKLNGIKRGIFSNLSVRNLTLVANEIKYIEQQAFVNLPNLEYLYLNYNQLSSIEENLFSNVPKMSYVGVNGNVNITVSANLQRYIRNKTTDLF